MLTDELNTADKSPATTRLFIVVFSLLLFACAAPDKKESSSEKSPVALDTTKATVWHTYIDTVNMGFILSFDYPETYIAEGIENGRCIGNAVKPETSEEATVSTGCCIWLYSLQSNNHEPVDTLIGYEIKSLKIPVKQKRDSITIAGVKGLRVVLYDKEKALTQMVYFTKYETFFEITNHILSVSEFGLYTASLQIKKQ
jgi:hypothetical protein